MGGFNYKNNKNNPNISNNSDEFGACSSFVKEFKIGLHPFLNYSKDGTLHKRLMKLFMAIKSLDRKSTKGFLQVGNGLEMLKGQLLLREFAFTPKFGIRQQFGNPNFNEDNFSLVWEDFHLSPTLFPKGGSHFEFGFLVLEYDKASNLFTTYKSALVRRSKTDPSERLELRPEKNISRKKEKQYILVGGIRFMEVLGDGEYELFGQGTLGIEVFGVC